MMSFSTLLICALFTAGLSAIPAGAAEAVPSSPDGKAYTSILAQEYRHRHHLLPETVINLSFKNGEVTADAGCDIMNGPVTITANKILITQLDTTNKDCDPAQRNQDAWLATFLKANPSWMFNSGALILRTGYNEIALGEPLPANPHQPLVNRYWVFEDRASRYLAEFSGWLLFQSDEKIGTRFHLAGRVGCMSLSGDGHAWRSDLSSYTNPTRIPDLVCMGDDRDKASTVSTVLRHASFEAFNDELEITGDLHPGPKTLRLRDPF